ncbi:MAG: hypothetical protein C0591_05910 [Marinilabiliales bacterium]|nr:MAG: hypothetical protein C0591_05910 [Marinilabiliales bacterium]
MCIFVCLFLSHNRVFADAANKLNQLDSVPSNPIERLTHIIDRAEAAWKDNDTENAESIALKGFILLRDQQLPDSIYAELLHIYGKILVDQQHNIQGIDSLLKSIQLKIQTFDEHHKSLSKTYNYIGIAYFQMRDYRKANIYYKMSAGILVKNGLWGPHLFDSYLNIGIVEAVQGKYDLAFNYFDTTRMVLDSIGLKVDSLLIARFYLNYGALATLNGKFEEGNSYLNKGEIIFQKKYGSDYLRISDINLNKGLNAYFNYDFKKAELYYKKALEIYSQNNNAEDRISRAVGNLAAVNLKIDQYDQAIQYCHIGLEYEPPDELKWLLYSNLTQAYIAKNDEENALINFNRAIDLEEEGKVSSIKKINLYIEFANFLLKKDQFAESKKYYLQAAEFITNSFGQNAAAYARILSRLGYYYLATNSIDSSLRYFNDAISIWNDASDSSGSNIETYNEVRFAESYIGRARAYYKKYTETNNPEFLEAGSRDIKMILERMEQVISKLDKESKLLLFEQLKPSYNLAIEISYEQNRLSEKNDYLQEVFNYMERSKSAVLLASVRNLNALKSSDVPANIMQLEKQLNEEINGLRQLLADEKQKQYPAIDKISFFETKLLSLLLEHDSLVDNLEENYPKYYALKYDRSTIQLPLLIEKIGDDEAIIEYEIADSAIYIYAITKNGITIRDTRIDTTFWNSLNYLLTVKDVDISEFRKSEIRQFYEYSNILWKQLIEPVCHFVKEKKLIIIPDGVLGYLPFEILARTTEHPEELTFKSMPYLLNEFPVSYSYSSTLKYNPYFVKKEAVNNHELIAFAPDYGQDNENPSQTRNLIFENLPNSKHEVISIEEMWGGKLFLGNDATKSNFIKKAGNYNVIHLAMHAMINDSVPMFSKLVFSETKKDTSTSFLSTYEIYDLVLNASMVTLSACNTGTGILRSGEGIMSLARGFIYAGVPSIVMTLWEVQDKSGSDIMTRYYRNLTRGDAKDVALQKAKLEFLKDSPDYSTHPFYWSAYIVTGDTQPIKNSKLPFIYSFGALGILILTTLILWLIIRHKKRSGKTI